MAKILRRGAGKPGYPATERAEEMAISHDIMAKVIERYIAGGCIERLWKSPSIIPGLPEVEKPKAAPPVRLQEKRKPAAALQLRLPGF